MHDPALGQPGGKRALHCNSSVLPVSVSSQLSFSSLPWCTRLTFWASYLPALASPTRHSVLVRSPRSSRIVAGSVSKKLATTSMAVLFWQA